MATRLKRAEATQAALADCEREVDDMPREGLHRIPLEVVASYRTGSSPQPERFRLLNAVYEVVEVIDRWYQGAWRAGGSNCSYFKVRTRSGCEFLLALQEDTGDWYLIKSFGPEQVE